MTTNNNMTSLKLALSLLLLPNLAWSAGESCNALLNLGLYNVNQSSSASDAQAMSLSTFCSADYSNSSISAIICVVLKFWVDIAALGQAAPQMLQPLHRI